MNFEFNLHVFAISTLVILLTPGPTNTLLAVAGLGLGTRRALPLIAFELAGYLTSITAWGIFLASAQHRYPWIGVSVRVAASCYLAYIAVKTWRDTTAPLAADKKVPIGPNALFMATLLNPKALVFASAIFPSHAFDDLGVYLAATLLFSCFLVPVGALWIRFGAALSSGRLMNPLTLQRAAACIIGLFSVSIAWTALYPT